MPQTVAQMALAVLKMKALVEVHWDMNGSFEQSAWTNEKLSETDGKTYPRPHRIEEKPAAIFFIFFFENSQDSLTDLDAFCTINVRQQLLLKRIETIFGQL